MYGCNLQGDGGCNPPNDENWPIQTPPLKLSQMGGELNRPNVPLKVTPLRLSSVLKEYLLHTPVDDRKPLQPIFPVWASASLLRSAFLGLHGRWLCHMLPESAASPRHRTWRALPGWLLITAVNLPKAGVDLFKAGVYIRLLNKSPGGTQWWCPLLGLTSSKYLAVLWK